MMILNVLFFHPRSLGLCMYENKKCVCLCGNCHREFHYFEKHQGITIKDYLS